MRRLLDLQEVDEFIAEARVKQKKLPQVVAAELTAFQEATAQLQAAEVLLAKHEAFKREREGELADQEAHIERLKGRLKEITNTREYQAHIQEMDTAQRAISKLEEEVLQALADIDTVKEEIAGHRTVFDERRAVYNAERAKVDVELATLDAQVSAFQGKKVERAALVPPLLLRRYERITQSVRRAVVAVEGYNCAGCNMNVPPQLVSEVKRGNGIHQCPHCQRLLYVPAPPVEETAAG
ncbi:MAG: hypothetical protein HZA24_08000 [Nitrospirae bacterium]|nr:hypothetical protein [Nitrospirota bacterium]